MGDLVSDRVRAKAAQIFGTEAADEATRILAAYDGPARERVQLAALKLADGSLDRLAADVEAACIDYRDVIAGAEFPEEMARTPRELRELDPAEREALRATDRRQYEDWLEGDASG